MMKKINEWGFGPTYYFLFSYVYYLYAIIKI